MRGSVIPIILGLVVLAAVATVLFVFPYNPTHPPEANDTNWTPEGLKAVVDGNNEFALDMYHQLENSSGRNSENVFFSPYSIYSAMGMLYEGARGNTASQIKAGMHFPDPEILEPNYAHLYNRLNGNSSDYTLRTGNALWVQAGFKISEEYKKRVEEFFGGKAAELDFVGNPVKSIETINRFISEQTNGKIKNLLGPGSVDAYTRLIITNAVYFKGTWVYQFDKSKTRDMPFHLENGGTVNVKMMYMKPDKQLYYLDTGNAQILKLPYSGNISMLIILPKGSTKIKDLENSLDWETLKTWESQMKPTRIKGVYLPKFKLETKYHLENPLKGLGITEAFNPVAADLSGIADGLYVKSVIHKAYVNVDEEGTEAAAATAIVIGITAVNPQREIVFKADHPFMFIIQDDKTGAILFIGKLGNPQTESTKG